MFFMYFSVVNRNFVSDLPTLKPKKPLKPLKTKNLKNWKNKKKSKKPSFLPALTQIQTDVTGRSILCSIRAW